MNRLFLLCTLAGRLAAMPTEHVRSVIQIDTVTPIPGTPDFIVGLTALRSEALTVIDCRVSLGFSPSERIAGTRAAVVRHEGHSYALLVDEAFDVVEALSEPVPIAGGFGEGWQHAALGMIEVDSGPVVMIDVQRLIASPRPAQAA